MKRLFLSYIFAIATIALCAQTSGTCGDDLTWTLGLDGVLTIEGSDEMTNYTDTDSPWKGSEEVLQVVIKEGVRSVGENAFSGCTNLTSVIFPESVYYIRKGAFKGCTKLDGVVMPRYLVSIEDQAFANCKSLVNLDASRVGYIGKQAFRGAGLRTFIADFFLKSIGEAAFNHCENLENVVINSYTVDIGANAFSFCKSLNTVVLPSRNTVIGDYAFSNCSSLENIAMPPSIKQIGRSAFDMSGLKSVTIPKVCTEIYPYAIASSNLTDVIVRATTPPAITGSSIIGADGYKDNVVIHVPKGSIEDYKAHTYWGKFKNICEDGVADLPLSSQPEIYLYGEVGMEGINFELPTSSVVVSNLEETVPYHENVFEHGLINNYEYKDVEFNYTVIMPDCNYDVVSEQKFEVPYAALILTATMDGCAESYPNVFMIDMNMMKKHSGGAVNINAITDAIDKYLNQ